MARQPVLSVTEAREILEYLCAATQAADPHLLAPIDWIKRFTNVVWSVAPREEQYRYRLDGFHGITMGRLHRNVEALLRNYDGLVEDNPRLTQKERSAG